MGKNFDEEGPRLERFERDKTFVIAGETFHYLVGLRPEDFNERIAPFLALPDQPKSEEAIPVYDECIRNLLRSDEDRELWDSVRERPQPLDPEDSSEQAITAHDMRLVFFHMVGEQTGRDPTPAPTSSDSGRSRENGGGRSTARSSSAVVASGDSLD